MVNIVNKLKDLEVERNVRTNYIKRKFSLESLAEKHVELYTNIVRGNEW